MTDILVAPIFHTGNVDISQELNFFPFLFYSSHLREKKKIKRSSLKMTKFAKSANTNLPMGLSTVQQLWGIPPAPSAPSPKIGNTHWDGPGCTENQFAHLLQEGWICYLCEGCTPAQSSAIPACQQGILHGPSGPDTSHTQLGVESPLSHRSIHKNTALWRRPDQN